MIMSMFEISCDYDGVDRSLNYTIINKNLIVLIPKCGTSSLKASLKIDEKELKTIYEIDFFTSRQNICRY